VKKGGFGRVWAVGRRMADGERGLGTKGREQASKQVGSTTGQGENEGFGGEERSASLCLSTYS
jgi:hypothetical protein